MASLPKKQYGLILKKENAKLSSGSKVAAAFADDDDDRVDTNVMSSENASVSTMRVRMQARREHERALAENPSVFQYDEIYDELQAVRDAKQAEQKSADKERKPKYVEQILKAHKKRTVEQQIREERKQEKERVAEGEMYKDKEVFVTGAYRKQMEEAQELRKELAVQDRIDELTAVDKQKLWQSGFQRTLLNELARDEPVPGSSKDGEKEQPGDGDMKESPSALAKHSETLKSLRRRVVSNEEDVLPGFSEPKIVIKKEPPEDKPVKKPVKKSIYSDESEDEPPPEIPKEELKPGLNILKQRKKSTKAEQLRSRFTPPDSSSEEEASDKRPQRYRKRSNDNQEERGHRKDDDRRMTRRSRSREERRRKRSENTDDRRKRSGRDDERAGHSEKRKERSRSPRDSDRHRRKEDSRKADSRHEERSGRRRSRSPEESGPDRHHKKRDEKRAEKSRSSEKKSVDIEKKKTPAKPKTKEERLMGLKKILGQRSGEAEVAEFRRRYLERKESKFVTLPL